MRKVVRMECVRNHRTRRYGTTQILKKNSEAKKHPTMFDSFPRLPIIVTPSRENAPRVPLNSEGNKGRAMERAVNGAYRSAPLRLLGVRAVKDLVFYDFF